VYPAACQRARFTKSSAGHFRRENRRGEARRARGMSRASPGIRNPSGDKNMRIVLAWTAAVAALVASPAFAAEGPKAKPTHEGQVVELSVTNEGFVPAKVVVKAGKPVTLVITRKTERTCATEIVIKDFGIKKDLPLNRPVTLTFTPKKPGPIRYACAMDMIAGTLTGE
jgi:plastocyanin